MDNLDRNLEKNPEKKTKSIEKDRIRSMSNENLDRLRITDDKVEHKTANDKLEKAKSAYSEKKIEEIKHAAAEGDKRAQGILPKWETSVEEGRIGPAARGKTAYGGTEDWTMATRESIKKDSNIPKEVKANYEQQDSRIKKSLNERANGGDKRAQNIIDDPKKLEDYLARRNREPPGFELGHRLGDKLGDKTGKLENIDMNRGKGKRIGL